jgi:hypothetical protein
MAKFPHIEPPDSHCISAAVGWLELGNAAEARKELASITPAFQNHPDVLEVGWLVAADEEAWEEGLHIARRLLREAPERCTGWLHQAYALRRVPGGSVAMAWDALLPAYEKFPEEAIVAYNLACYACQMEQLGLAREWFSRAQKVGGKERINSMALQDPDLERLWDEIRG